MQLFRSVGPPHAHPAIAGWTTWWAPRPLARVEAWQDFAAAVAWLLGLQILDLLTTLGALANGATEANPFAAAFFAGHGAAGLVQLKLVALLLSLGWIPAFAWSQPGSTVRWGTNTVLGLLVLLVVIYSGVVLNNLAVISGRFGT